LSVKKSTCNAMIYFELERLPLSVTRTFRMIKFLFKLLSTDNCILNASYNIIKHKSEKSNPKYNWVSFIKDNLFELGFGEVWLKTVTLRCFNFAYHKIKNRRPKQSKTYSIPLKFQVNVIYTNILLIKLPKTKSNYDYTFTPLCT